MFLGTGFVREMPAMIRRLAASLGLDHIRVSRRYRLRVDEPATAACYLQGVNEATHGIADSLLSVVAHRAADIVHDVLAHRAPAAGKRDETRSPPLTVGPVDRRRSAL